MSWLSFSAQVGLALFFGGLIGLERQWRQRSTGLRTNGLVAVGAAMFVIMGGLLGGHDGQVHVAAYVVSGIGFLGGGVILKEGANVRGVNTAATLWCTAAIGTLVGAGQIRFAALGTAGVLVANLLLRPIARLINRTPIPTEGSEILYHLHCTCRTPREAHIRALLLQAVGPMPLQLLTLQSKDQEGADYVDVSAKLRAVGRKDEYLEQIVTRLSLEADVTSISWHVISMIDTEEAELTNDAEAHG
jgi:putative Mg2+ transporter-C (MgtC) family protein